MKIKPDAPMEARIVDWDDTKGYGFLQVGSGRVFLHRRDFAERHKRPEVGDMIRFTVGLDARGRTCAKEAVHVNDGGRLSITTVVVLLGLLVLPAIAVVRSGVDWRWAAGYAVLISVMSYASHTLDKRRARAKEWRVSESALHLPELLGGWPGSFLAQRRLRHKVSKAGYQILFWFIVLAWQFAAFDSMQEWKYSRALWDRAEQKPGWTLPTSRP
jgi:uncharacterized membrane protein YsdA (DUF1294 family)/cold shock CspA family protein